MKLTAFSRLLVLAAACCLCVCACDKPEPEQKSGTKIKSIRLTPSEVTIHAGSTAVITAKVSPALAVPPAISWTTDNGEVATVSGGVITGIGDGTATVTAICEDASATVKVTVFGKLRLKKGETLVMPVEDSFTWARMFVKDKSGDAVGPDFYYVSPSKTVIDYYTFFKADQDVTIEFSDLPDDALFWSNFKITTEAGPMANPSPKLHYRPANGWMNDPNGCFYHDGKWHLYCQNNPLSAQSQNNSWGHGVSTDLYNWEQCATALSPDKVGLMWSGTCIVDEKNVSGFGANAVLAYYTPTTNDGVYRQCIAMAYSVDGGYTFTKYNGGNPILTYRPSGGFRDPKVIWSEKAGKWLLIATRDSFLEMFSSTNLVDWTEYGRIENPLGHEGLECPDLFPLKYGDGEKWVLLTSTPGRAGVGYAVAYSIGEFDGKNYKKETGGWVDYGFEFYAAQTFNHAPVPTVIGWASNFKYLYAEPAKGLGYRGEMSVPRKMFLMNYNGGIILGTYPVDQVLEKGAEYIQKKTVSDGESLKIGIATYAFNGSKLSVSRSWNNESTEAPIESRASHDVLIVRYEKLTEMFIDGGAVALTVRDW